MKKKILITGSSGHSGSQIAALLGKTYDIVGVDIAEGKYTSDTGSLTDKDFLLRATEGVTAIIHTASLHAPHVATHSRKDFIDTNISGTLNLLEASESNGVTKFIYTSTTSLYGESLDAENQAVWITEEVPTIPRDIYDITKIAAEGLCRDFFNKERLQTAVLRVSRFWNEPMERRLFYRMYRGVDVRDVALAHKLAIEKDLQKFDVFNISAQSIFTADDLRDLKHNLRILLEKKNPKLIAYYAAMNWPLPDSIDRVYVIDKAKRELGYNPEHNIKEMLEAL
ncbi:NAD(P)-dependent oxidoreductase [Fulvivirga kasyanovii]|uniref:NAD(P)-dependent oxidoreductase n=1 Tax=Fulvivirga kasyanovii TaxID=396812 RepID=A0ABW9RN26_9BACT|nr:NAD(P)-dependent oxidoreductase [Fulvivirga kasyanovii]MTI25197.1 NAD(P)-dependent oxidoreductase [Fulvivirga kasyanovii]